MAEKQGFEPWDGLTRRRFSKPVLSATHNRMEVSVSRIQKIEGDENSGAVTIKTMRRVAEAMDCVFVYAVIPRTDLDESLKIQALKKAKQHLQNTSHSMSLEDQSIDKKANEEMLKSITTTLEPEEVEGLIPTHVVNRDQLNELEQQNITEASIWLMTARLSKINSDANLKKLHKQMFGQIWKWAGKFRHTGKNIGVDAYKIPVELRNLCDDVDTWIEFSSYPEEEIAVRFHHRLVYIHLFPNGNGRHARLATDVLLNKQFKRPSFTWGSGIIDEEGEIRHRYIKALRMADKGDYKTLSEFVKS
ncbi:Adenosine monophosphate-protein transferase Fic [Nymphon striatum]|nr:Adenosine monophosphate-protein transferase Fic [Nymphon striatum]